MHTLFSLANRHALITGGTKGIGKSIADLFLEAGAASYITGKCLAVDGVFSVYGF